MTSWVDEAQLRNWLVHYLVTTIGCSPEDVHLDAPLNELGVGSRDAVVLAGELTEKLGRTVSPVEFWQNPTINTLAHGLLNPDAEPVLTGAQAEGSLHEPIAVIGLGCRLPGDIADIEGPDGFWQFLSDGRSAVGQVPDGRWQMFDDGTPETRAVLARTTKWGSFLSDVAEFDAEYFDISPSEADRIDPQQRLLLEVAVEALDHAGIPVETLQRSQTGVFAGACVSEYGFLASADLPRIDAWTGTGGALSIIANRLSYFLDARGPSVTIDTACSSSLVAIHLACRSLRLGESDLALAAGVNLVLAPNITRSFDTAEAMSRSGACRAFDAGADGFVRGEGCGVVVLKRLSGALRDGNRILAVVRGSAMNQDGRSNGLMAPNPAAQTAVLRAACADAGIEPLEVDYVEAHGTGTLLGDPIEARGLGSVYGRGRAPDAPLLIGSVKSNVGHLEAAAGVVGFIKATLAVNRARIPANLHFDAPNPHIPFDELRLKVVDEATNWPSTGRPRRAGVSSFGFGGTNAHLVLEQAPAPAATPLRVAGAPVTTLVVSGKTPARVAQWAEALADWMDGPGAVVPLADIAHTLNHHRARQGVFATVAARDRDQAVAGLRALAAGRSGVGVVGPHSGACGSGTVFVYSGQGSQWAGMGRQLLADEPAFAAAVDELEPVFVAEVGFSLHDVLAEGRPVEGSVRVQSVIAGVQLALTALWRSYGVQPDAVIGHSMGEVSAAVVAGALTPAEGLRVIATRARLMAGLADKGAVGLVELPADEAEALIAGYPGVSVSVYSSPRQTVVAGPTDAVEAVLAAAGERNVFARRVNMEVASHTAMMDPIVGQLRTELADLLPGFPTVPVIVTTAGREDMPTFDADHWCDNVRNPVRFAQAVANAAEQHTTFIEISPHPVLTHAIDDIVSPAHHHGIGTLQRDTDDTVTFHTNLNAAHTKHPPRTVHLPEPHPQLPSAPWQHSDHWFTTTQRRMVSTAAPSQPRADTGPRQTDAHRFAHRIAWLPREDVAAPPDSATIAVVGPDLAADTRVGQLLGDRGHRSADLDDAELVLYVADNPPGADFDAAVRLCADVTALAKRLTERSDRRPATLWVLTRGVLEGEPSSLPQSSLWGLANVIAAEQPQIWGALMDVDGAAEPEQWVPAVAGQLGAPSKPVLVLRAGEVRAAELAPLEAAAVRPALHCRRDAAYLVTGGLGAIGLATANWLADLGARRIVLAGRTALPPRRQWGTVTNPVDAARIAGIRDLENRGVAIELATLDVAAPGAVRDLLERRDDSGAPPVRGVVHAAGITGDRLLTDLDESSLRAVLAPKIAGAAALHEAFPADAVDFLFLTASAATVFGVPGQASYAAANAYLDALARSRQRAGGLTQSIDWVAWRDMGFGADAALVVAELERLGSRPVEADEAFAAWEHIATLDVAQAVVIPVADGDIPGGARHLGGGRDWSQLSPDEVYLEVSEGLRAILARELRIAEPDLPLDRPFIELGLNSIMAMSIRREAEQLVGMELSATMLWNHPTVSALATFLTGKLGPQSDPSTSSEPAPAAESGLGVLDNLFDSVEAGVDAAVPSWGDDR
ncbi:MAG: acyltransferase domain-containing protein [Mycobacterium sp.]|nr:acyltransferase domain-containing protein [Mycobacterium sp.]